MLFSFDVLVANQWDAQQSHLDIQICYYDFGLVKLKHLPSHDVMQLSQKEVDQMSCNKEGGVVKMKACGNVIAFYIETKDTLSQHKLWGKINNCLEGDSRPNKVYERGWQKVISFTSSLLQREAKREEEAPLRKEQAVTRKKEVAKKAKSKQPSSSLLSSSTDQKKHTTNGQKQSSALHLTMSGQNKSLTMSGQHKRVRDTENEFESSSSSSYSSFSSSCGVSSSSSLFQSSLSLLSSSSSSSSSVVCASSSSSSVVCDFTNSELYGHRLHFECLAFTISKKGTTATQEAGAAYNITMKANWTSLPGGK